MKLTIQISVNDMVWEFWEQINPTEENLRNLCVGVARSVFRAKAEADGKLAETPASHDTTCKCGKLGSRPASHEKPKQKHAFEP